MRSEPCLDGVLLFGSRGSTEDEAMEDALAFARRQTVQRGLYLWGRLGRGKTSLAISILKVFLGAGESALYIRAPQYLRLVNQAARGNGKHAPILDLAYAVTCLVLDDLQRFAKVLTGERKWRTSTSREERGPDKDVVCSRNE